MLIVTPVASLARRDVQLPTPQGTGLPTPGVPGLNLPSLQSARQLMPAPTQALWFDIRSNIDNFDAIPPLPNVLGAYCEDCDPCPDCGDPCPGCPDPPNQQPVANAGGPYQGTPGATVQFNGTGSYDPDGTIVSYEWSFGDGATDTGDSPTHVYAAAGTY